MDLGSLAAAATSLQVVGKIAKGMISLNTMAEVQSTAIDLNEKLIAAQQDVFSAYAAQSALIERITDLEKQIAQIRNWEEQKKRYKLAEPWGNSGLVYGVKVSSKDTEPPHWICTKCYDDGRRTILQPRADANLWLHMTCPTCDSKIPTNMRGVASPAYVPD